MGRVIGNWWDKEERVWGRRVGVGGGGKERVGSGGRDGSERVEEGREERVGG